MPEGGAGPVVLDGNNLTVADLVRIARRPVTAVQCDPEALDRVARGRALVDETVARYAEQWRRWRDGTAAEAPTPEYGITTGFGMFKDVALPPDDLVELQRRLLVSHCVGVGSSADPDDPGNYLPADVVRAAITTRLNAFLKGHSGVRLELVAALRTMLNAGIVPLVPTQGSVGASGDLAPLSHLFATLLGVGRYYTIDDPTWRPAADLPTRLGLADGIGHKEGLALVNGVNVSAALLALAVHDAEHAVHAADAAVALALEATRGAARAFEPAVHEARRHRGQMDSAAAVRALVAGSSLVDGADDVQDPYSVRAAPQVHGATRDAIAFGRRVVEDEINAVTDNPLFFPDADPWDAEFAPNWPPGYRGDRRASYSAGNFHGQPVALAADFLAIAVAELASISERRTQMLLDPHHNRGLPANLVAESGLNSGLMAAQYTAAALVSENKVLAHPASVDSIPTSANVEDHVSMSTIAARKLRSIVGATQAVLAIELLTAAAAVEWRTFLGRSDPVPTAQFAEGATEQEAWLEARRAESTDFADHVAGTATAAALGDGTASVYGAVRAAIPPLTTDRPLDADIRAARHLVEAGTLQPAGLSVPVHVIVAIPPD